MRLVTLVIVMAALGLVAVLPAAGQNPFMKKPGPASTEPESPRQETAQPDKSPAGDQQRESLQAQEPGWWDTALFHINKWQRVLKQRISHLGRQVRDQGEIGSLLIILGLGFAYGALHAAGPGHGKAISLAYVVTRRRLGQGLIMGSLLALFHGISGIVLIVVTSLILKGSVRQSLPEATQTAQIISYSLISILGLALLLRSFLHMRKRKNVVPSNRNLKDAPPWLVALAGGLIPCPGVVLVMLFFISLDMFWVGLLTALSVSLGMAATINLLSVLAYLGKDASIRLANRIGGINQVGEWVELMAALAIFAVGLLLLFTTLQSSGPYF